MFATLPDAILRVEMREPGGTPILSDDSRFEIFLVEASGGEVQEGTYVGRHLAQPRRPGRYRVVGQTSRGKASATFDVAPADRSTHILELP